MRKGRRNRNNPLFVLSGAKTDMKVHVSGLKLLTRTELTHAVSPLLEGVPSWVPERLGDALSAPSNHNSFLSEHSFLSPTFPSVPRSLSPKEPSWGSGLHHLPTPFSMPGTRASQARQLPEHTPVWIQCFAFVGSCSINAKKSLRWAKLKRNWKTSGQSPIHSSQQKDVCLSLVGSCAMQKRKWRPGSPSQASRSSQGVEEKWAKRAETVAGSEGVDRGAQENLPEEVS